MLEGPPAETVTPPASDSEPASETKVKALLPPFLAARTLKGDLVRFILDRLQHEQGDRRPWNERPEEQQRETIRQVGDAVEEALRRGFIMMQGDQSKLITALVGKIATGKNGWVAQVHFGDDGEKSLPLIRGSGKIVQIALADANADDPRD
jgi:hypothetical protein